MKGANKDLFNPKPIMESDQRTLCTVDADFGFAFNDINFSDRLLQIEIMGHPESSRSDGQNCTTITITDWAANRKRRRDGDKQDDVVDLTLYPAEQILNENQPDIDYCMGGEDQDKEAMVEESLSGDKDGNHESNWGMDTATLLTVKTLHISSPILAAKSPFFYKLFSNGMKESEQRHVTLRINAFEEPALMELLNFMYSNTLSVTSPSAVLDVLMAADKYEVASCMRYCSRLLQNMPMTAESALLYLELPLSVLMTDSVQPLTDAAKRFLSSRYQDVGKFVPEIMALPLTGIEAVFSSDELYIASEDSVYDILIKWAGIHYPKLEERQEVMGSCLSHYIRFPHMTCRKLRKALTCNDFSQEISRKLVMEALFFKSEAPHKQRRLVAEEPEPSNRRFVERAYKYKPVKVVELDFPRPQCLVYLDLKRKDLASLFPSGRLYSQAFHLDGQGFFLSAHCNMEQENNFHCFGLFLGMQERGEVRFPVEYEFSVRSKPSMEFSSKYNGSYVFTGGKAVGYRSLFGIVWDQFICDESPYFINDTLHLKAELTIRKDIWS